MSSAPDYRQVLERIASWPVAGRLSLVHDIVATTRGASRRAAAPRDTLARARGLLRGAAPPPDDDDVKRIIHEHRMQKYG
jgi:hypothetical protein